jgi:hypothetical protein
MKTLTVVGKRWFARTYGNTYHSVEVVVDGQSIGNSGKHYGYGDQYLQTATAMLMDKGLVPDIEKYENGGHESLWRYAEKRGINYTYHVSDVARERDL